MEEETSSKTTGHMTGSSYLNIYCIYMRLAYVAWFANFNDFFPFCLDLCSDETDNSPPLQLHTLKEFEQVRALF